jgi:hypothetical protein
MGIAPDSMVVRLGLFLLVVTAVVIGLAVHHYNAQAALLDPSSWKIDRSLLHEEPPRESKPKALEIRQQAVHYIIAPSPQASPTPCQICQERLARYRAAMLDAQIIVRAPENTLEVRRATAP